MSIHKREIKCEFCIFPKRLYLMTTYGFLLDAQRMSGFFQVRQYVIEPNGKKYYLYDSYYGRWEYEWT